MQAERHMDEKAPLQLSRRSTAAVNCVLVTLVALACAAHFTGATAQTLGEIGAVSDPNAVVYCRLPSVVRKMGQNAMRQVPGATVKVSAKECEIRGGQYVLFDRADPATALKIWLSSAEQGDAMAQFRVGQIYEMGLGVTPDYPAAAGWYKKASDQGNRAAAINLAVLYEKGLGVSADPTTALNLYRKAQGLTDDLVMSKQVSTLKDSLNKAQDRVNQLEQEIRQLRQSGASTSLKERELNEVRAQLEQVLGRKDLPLGVAVDVGERAGSQPSIQLIDPNLVLTRGNSEVAIRAAVKSQPVVGRVRSRHPLSSLTVNEKDIALDRFGFFETAVALAVDSTPVRIIAIDRVGGRDEVSITLRNRETLTEKRSPAAAPGSNRFGNYHALVIGNNAYRAWPTLRTPVEDAKSVAEILQRKYGFRTKMLVNATFEQTLNALNDLVRALGEKDNLLIYYAGHGSFDLGKRGYWIPVDAEVDRNTRWILNVQITDLLLKMNARKIMVVSDSCYSGALTAAENGAIPTILSGISDETRSEIAKQLSDVQSRTILTSGALQPVWDVGLGQHSLFATAFLEVLAANDSILEGYRLFESIEARVIRDSRKIREREVQVGRKPGVESDQTPFYAAIQHAGHQGADFLLVPVSR